MKYRDILDHVLLDTREKVAAGSTADVLNFPQVPTGRVWVIEKIVVYDASNAPSSAKAYIDRGGPLHLVGSIGSFTAAEAGVIDGPIYVPEAAALKVYVVGATGNDSLTVTINGYELISMWAGSDYQQKAQE